MEDNTQYGSFVAKPRIGFTFSSSGRSGNGSTSMETEDDEGLRVDPSEVPLPDPPAPPQPEGRDVRDVFDDHCKRIGDVSRFGQVSEDRNGFKVEIPDQVTTERIPTMQPVIGAATKRYGQHSEGILAAWMVLPVPVHVSPLALALLRDPGCSRCTDAISCLKRLEVMRIAILEMDTSDPRHKNDAKVIHKTLCDYASFKFYTELDRIIAAGTLPAEERTQEQCTDAYYVGLLEQFGCACERFALDLIHCVEWNIADMFKIPISARSDFMTPCVFPDAISAMTPTTFSILRQNLCNYVRNRHAVLVPKDHVDDSWKPMHLNRPKLETRIHQLSATEQTYGVMAQDVRRGIYKGWISLHTLEEYMHFLSKDTRLKPAPTEEELREQMVSNQEQATPFHMYGKEPELGDLTEVFETGPAPMESVDHMD